MTIHAKTDYTAKMTLSELEAQLDDHFFRLGRSALVNLGCVARVTRTTVVLTDGSALPLPRGAYDRINRAMHPKGVSLWDFFPNGSTGSWRLISGS